MRLSGLLASLLLGSVALAPGCAYVSSPFVGFGGFIADTHSFYRGPNAPREDGPNMRRVSGREVDIPPLTPEPGNVWPGPQPPDPTLEDLERQQNNPGAAGAQSGYYSPATNPPPGAPNPQQRPITRGSSTPPDPSQPPAPAAAPRFQAPRPPPLQSAPPIRAIPTPQGPAIANPSGGGVQTYTAPGGGVGIVVPNGNGTNTLIAPDGSVSTAPQQR